MKRLRRWTSTVLLAGMLTWGGSAWADEAGSTSKGYDWTDEVRKLLENFHLSEPTEEELQQAEVEAMIRLLDDPYTVYYPKAKAEHLLEALNENMPAIGIQLGADGDRIYIVHVEPGSPAETNGLQEGDVIVRINGTETTPDNIGALLGTERKAGDSVRLELERGSKTVDVTLALENVKFNPVQSVMLKDRIGMLRLAKFTADADTYFSKELDSLEAQGMQSLILDLRGNPGGYIETAKLVAKHFIGDSVLAKTRSRDGEGSIPIEDGRKALYPIFVLVDGGTASASEMLAGALQDAQAATVIGTTTYGKGVTQLVLPLMSGKGILTVTTMEYFTPKGRKVNKSGIQPDLTAAGELEPLLRALRLAGASRIELRMDEDGTVKVNDAVLSRKQSFETEQGSTYVPIRTLAGAAGWDVTWNGGDGSVTVSRGEQSVRFGAEELLAKGAVRYADAFAFVERVSGLHVMMDGDMLLMESAGDKQEQ